MFVQASRCLDLLESDMGHNEEHFGLTATQLVLFDSVLFDLTLRYICLEFCDFP